MKITFNDLLSKTLADWPDEIDLSDLVKSSNESTRYSIKGLYEVSEKISNSYIGVADEVVLRNLNDALYEVLLGAAKFTTRIKLAELRTEAIRTRFEIRLHDGISMPELNYSPEDMKLVNDYFFANKLPLD